jgi:hypothetical protein
MVGAAGTLVLALAFALGAARAADEGLLIFKTKLSRDCQ